MSQHIEYSSSLPTHHETLSTSSRTSLWSVLLLTTIGLFLLLIAGTYLFNWTWTGFRNNTLWDWLQLLVLPVVLTVITIWFSSHKRWSVVWTWLIILALVGLLVCIFGGYFLNWTWTGFHNNTLWDWLKLFVLPTVLTAVTVWFSTHMNEMLDRRQANDAFSRYTFTQPQPSNQSVEDQEIEYNDSTVYIQRPYPVQPVRQK